MRLSDVTIIKSRAINIIERTLAIDAINDFSSGANVSWKRNVISEIVKI